MALSATRVFPESEKASAVRHTKYDTEDVIIGSGQETSVNWTNIANKTQSAKESSVFSKAESKTRSTRFISHHH